MSKSMSPARQKLIELSQLAKQMIQTESDQLDKLPDGVAPTINNVLLHVFYPPGEYHTYKQWLERGCQVQKGSKAFLVWGRKRTFTRQGQDADTGEATEKEYKAFPTANLFHRDQVKPLEVDTPPEQQEKETAA